MVCMFFWHVCGMQLGHVATAFLHARPLVPRVRLLCL